jgi:hypothetical protein
MGAIFLRNIFEQIMDIGIAIINIFVAGINPPTPVSSEK